MKTSEFAFACKVRQALNQNLEQLPASAIDRLASVRNEAIKRKKRNALLEARVSQRTPAGHVGHFFDDARSWAGSIGLAIPVIAVAVGLFGIYQSQQRQCITETAEIDTQIMTDELPLVAYLDKGFNTYLEEQDK